ncbi:MAG: glycosyltransferase family 4 protein [bacterium]|nr:glycosyltransferase family 4 protein [bacterium]
MTKILYIITRLDKGGAAQSTLLKVKGLQDKYDITLATGSVKDIDILGINVVVIPSLVRNISPIKDFICVFELYKLIRRGRFDIVDTHSSKAGFLGRVAAKLAGCPIIIHKPHGHVFYGYFSKSITLIFILLERFSAKFTNKIICLTPAETKDYLSLKISGDIDKFVTVHSGVELDPFINVKVDKKAKKEEFGLNLNSPVIICNARLVPVKGHRYLIEAAKKVVETIPDTKFLIVGDGPLRKKLERMVCKLGLTETVLFLGDRADIPELLAISDIFVLASLNEGMGRVIIEAMASGLPVVATNVGGIPTVVVDGVTGILIPSKDSESLSQAILHLLKDKELASNMGKNGKERAFMYSADKMIEKIDNLYKNLLTSQQTCVKIKADCFVPINRDSQ